MLELIHPDDMAAAAAAFQRDISGPGIYPPAAYRFRTHENEWRTLELTATNCLDNPAINGIVFNARDITSQVRLERAQRTLSAVIQLVVHSADESTLLENVCRMIVEVGDYQLAWVGYVEHDEARTIRPVAVAGEPADAPDVPLSWADDERGQGPSGAAVRYRSHPGRQRPAPVALLRPGAGGGPCRQPPLVLRPSPGRGRRGHRGHRHVRVRARRVRLARDRAHGGAGDGARLRHRAPPQRRLAAHRRGPLPDAGRRGTDRHPRDSAGGRRGLRQPTYCGDLRPGGRGVPGGGVARRGPPRGQGAAPQPHRHGATSRTAGGHQFQDPASRRRGPPRPDVGGSQGPGREKRATSRRSRTSPRRWTPKWSSPIWPSTTR